MSSGPPARPVEQVPKACGDCESCRWGDPCDYDPRNVTDYADFKPGRTYVRLRSGVYREVTG